MDTPCAGRSMQNVVGVYWGAACSTNCSQQLGPCRQGVPGPFWRHAECPTKHSPCPAGDGCALSGRSGCCSAASSGCSTWLIPSGASGSALPTAPAAADTAAASLLKELPSSQCLMITLLPSRCQGMTACCGAARAVLLFVGSAASGPRLVATQPAPCAPQIGRGTQCTVISTNTQHSYQHAALLQNFWAARLHVSFALNISCRQTCKRGVPTSSHCAEVSSACQAPSHLCPRVTHSCSTLPNRFTRLAAS